MKFASILFGLIFSSVSFAKTIDFQITLSFNSEGAEVSEEELLEKGCDSRFIEDSTCVIEKVIDESDLPFSLVLGDAYFELSQSGLIELGISYGDSDGTASGSLQLPIDDNGNLLSLPGPLKLNVSGGDHASGVWFVDGELKIVVE